MKSFMNTTIKRAWVMLLAFAMIFSWTASVFSESASADTDDTKYAVVYEKFEQLRRDPPLKPSEAYDQYGPMNGDYYVIALEENLRYLNGEKDIHFQDLVAIMDNLKKNGEISRDVRKALREAVTTYGLDENLIPYDPDFEEKPVNTSGSSMGAKSDSQIEKEMADILAEVRGEDPEGYAASRAEAAKAAEIAATMTPPPAERAKSVGNTGFTDVSPDAWYADAVAAMVTSGIVKGKDDGLFHPDDIITIGEWCSLIYRITYSDAQDGPVTSSGIYYSHWASEAMSQCIFNGYTEMRLGATVYGTGEPTADAVAQRGEAVTAVVKVLEDAKRKDSMLESRKAAGAKVYTWNDIPDAARIQENVTPSAYVTVGTMKGEPRYANTHYWDPDRILEAYNLGVTNGVDSAGTFNPDGTMTRAQACKMLYEAGMDRCLNLYSWGQSSIM